MLKQILSFTVPTLKDGKRGLEVDGRKTFAIYQCPACRKVVHDPSEDVWCCEKCRQCGADKISSGHCVYGLYPLHAYNLSMWIGHTCRGCHPYQPERRSAPRRKEPTNG